MDMKINRLRAMRWLMLVLGLAWGGIALAQAPAGIVVTETSGVVRYRIGDSAPMPVTKGQILPVGARITTAANAGVLLTFPDGMLVAIGEQSRLRVLDYLYTAADVDKSRVVFNLSDGSLRIAMGAIGQRNPGMIQLMVGEGRLSQALDRPRGSDIDMTVRGISALVQVAQGRVSLHVLDQTVALASGQSALIHSGGLVQVAGPAQLANFTDRTEDGRTMQGRFDRMLGSALGRTGQQIVITLSTPPDIDDEDDYPWRTQPPTTAATGAGGGGRPCGASCN
jgi:hypothetical protein